MKPGKMTTRIAAACMTASLICMGGCATTGMERAQKTTTSMQNVQNDIDQASMQIDATGAALDDLMNPGQQNLQESFRKYTANVDKMEQNARRLNRHTDQMKSRGNDYFEEWDKQENKYTNPQIQALSEQRRSQLRDTYSQISASSIGFRGALDKYVKDVKDIQRYLSNDLTPKGIQAIAPIAQRAKQDGEALKSELSPVQAAIQRVRSEMTPAPPAAPR